MQSAIHYNGFEGRHVKGLPRFALAGGQDGDHLAQDGAHVHSSKRGLGVFEPIIGIIAIYIVVLAGLPILLMWIADRFVGTWSAMAIGFLAIAFVIYGIASMSEICKPVCPAPGNEGACISPCSSPGGGILIYIFIWWAAPISLALLTAVTLFNYLKLRRQRYV